MAGDAVAAAAGSERVLLCGDVNGKFRLLVRLLQQVQQRQGPFGIVICCGSFFEGPPSATRSNSSSPHCSSSPSDSSKNASDSSLRGSSDAARGSGCSSTSSSNDSTSSSPGCETVGGAASSACREETKDSAAAAPAAEIAAASTAPAAPPPAAVEAEGSEAATRSVSSRSPAPEAGRAAAAAAADASARPAAGENGTAAAAASTAGAAGTAPAAVSLASILKEAYPEGFRELQEAAVKLPMPLYFIDEHVSTLVGVGWEVQQRGGDTEAAAAAKRKLTAETAAEEQQQCGLVSPQQICSNVFWMGRVGFARISRLRVALCALPNAEEQLLLQQEQQQQQQQRHPQAEQQQQAEQQEQQRQTQRQEKEDNVVEEGFIKRRRLSHDTSRVAGCVEAAVLPGASSPSAVASSLPPAETPSAAAEKANPGEGPALAAPASAGGPAAAPLSAGTPTAAAACSREWQEVAAAAASPQWEGRIDILVSCRWPADVLQQLQPLAASPEASTSSSSSEAGTEKLQALQPLLKAGIDEAVVQRQSSVFAARVSSMVEPRYLFAASVGLFYQRPPFRSIFYGYVSRFTALGFIGAKTPEAKPLHALQLQPIDTLLHALPRERLPRSLRPLPFLPGADSSGNGSSSSNGSSNSSNSSYSGSSNIVNSGDYGVIGSSCSSSSSRLSGCCTREAAAAAAEAKKAGEEAARAALSLLPSNGTDSPFVGFLPVSVMHQRLLQPEKKTDIQPAADFPSPAAGDNGGPAAGTAYPRRGGPDNSSSVLGVPPGGPSSTAAAIPPPPPHPPPPDAAGGPQRQGLQQRQQQPPRRSCCVVCVCNLPYNVDEVSLQKVMETFGEVKFVYAPRDSEDPSKGTGKAFVVFMKPESAEKAVEASGQLEAGRRVLRMAFWREKIPFAHRQQQQQRAKPGTVLITEAHADCWFCLANPKVEKHLVAAVGDTCYVAAPKGGLHPLHALVVPITHFPSLAFAPADVREEIGRQVEAYRRALKLKENLDCIVYERYVPMRATKAMHTQVQCVPCTTAQGYRAAEIFKKKAKSVGINLQPLDCTQNTLPFSELSQHVAGTERAYFYVDLPGMNTASGHRAERLFYCQSSSGSAAASAAGGHSGGRHNPASRLPMNFGREVVATVIDKPEMADWQNCAEDQSQEEARTRGLTKLLTPKSRSKWIFCR